jgi:hypothetical protein
VVHSPGASRDGARSSRRSRDDVSPSQHKIDQMGWTRLCTLLSALVYRRCYSPFATMSRPSHSARANRWPL